jgi:hypothetical protein
MAVNTEGLRLQKLMQWVRVLLPLSLAALGWFISHTIGSYDSRLELMESTYSEHGITYATHVATNDQKFKSIEDRLLHEELTVNEMVTLTQYLQRMNGFDKRLDRVETKIDTHNQK